MEKAVIAGIMPGFIGVRAGKTLRVRRIFVQISLNLPEKNSKENYFQKKVLK